MRGENHGHGRQSGGARHARLLAVFMAVFVAAFGLQMLPAALSAQGDDAAISQGFLADEGVSPGALVSVKPDSQNSVQLANTDRVDELVGVAGEKSLIELSGDDQQVQVVTSGTAQALVSTINGDIKTGDKITASPINGIGMRTGGGVQVVGTARADLSSVETTEQSITDKSGRRHFVRIGLLPVQVNVTYFAAPKRATMLPGFLQDLANSVAGREVSAVRVLVSAFVLGLGFVSIGVLLYSSVRSSIISIGRNPLSEHAVRKSLLQVGLTAIGILLLTVIAIYLILRT